jgi:serine/threonine-protein kinase
MSTPQGVLLFELLTGRLPYRHTGALRLSEIVSQPALRLRQALTLRTGKANDGSSERDKIAAARGVSAARLHGLLDNDLQRIVERALQKAPQDRYPSVRAMADDIDAWLTQRPLRSMPTPWPRRLQQFARRQRWAILLCQRTAFQRSAGRRRSDVAGPRDGSASRASGRNTTRLVRPVGECRPVPTRD